MFHPDVLFDEVTCTGILQTDNWNPDMGVYKPRNTLQYGTIHISYQMVAMVSFLHLEDGFTRNRQGGVYIDGFPSRKMYSSTVALLDPVASIWPIGVLYDVNENPLRGFRLLVTFHQVKSKSHDALDAAIVKLSLKTELFKQSY